VNPLTDENMIAAEVYQGLLAEGSEYPGDQPYVAAGARSGLAHATWSHRGVNEGDVVFLEVGGSIRRYAGAHMRVVACGRADSEIERRAKVVAEALTAAIEAIKPGARSGDVDAACRGVIERAGYGHFFRHRTGYSLGVAFPPGWGEGHIFDLKPEDASELVPDTVFHLVPILHDPDNHGVGMSETVLVTESGCEVLTDYPRELQVRP
jgi:Xaa-Pro dipeptidase